MNTTLTLWRPVGENEMMLIQQSAWKEFPLRLPGQPLFYPVCSLEYAEQIARDWNAKDGQKGYVLKFEIKLSFISRYERHIVGSRKHEEYWIPADHVPEFNSNIEGLIEIVKEFP